jgi:PAS domain S-box-containing protein
MTLKRRVSMGFVTFVTNPVVVDFAAFDYYRALFDNPKKNSVLLLDDTGIILHVNRAFLLSFGYDESDLIGEHFSLLFTPEDQERDLPMREVQMVLDEGQSFDNNYLMNRNGLRTWVSGESVLLSNEQGGKCVLKVIQNIHIQKESEQSIVRLNTFNESILATIADAVLVLDDELRIVKANRSFLELFSLEQAHLHLVDFRGLLQIADPQGTLYAAAVKTLQEKEERVVGPLQVELPDGHGRPRCFDVRVTLLDHSERDNVLLIFHDITTQKNQEQQREDLLNFVAHELRNPLTNIILNIDWLGGLIKEKEQGDYGEFIDRTRRNAERLKKLVNELNQSTKLISGNYDLQREEFGLDGLIEEGVFAMKQAHPTYSIVRKGDRDILVSGDKDKLLQVLTNYLSNAIKYSGGSLTIEVVVSVRDGLVEVAVVDKGTGIPVKELPYIFSRFYRAERTRSLEGLGVGLFLSRQIVEAHKGRTWVESVEGQGSTFYFSLPVD